MSLYLPNLILPPDDRQDLVLCIRHDGIVLDPWGNQIQTKAVHIPPHGRLGDLDALVKKSYEIKSCVGRYSRVVHIVDVKNADTIIPADPADKDGT